MFYNEKRCVDTKLIGDFLKSLKLSKNKLHSGVSIILSDEVPKALDTSSLRGLDIGAFKDLVRMIYDRDRLEGAYGPGTFQIEDDGLRWSPDKAFLGVDMGISSMFGNEKWFKLGRECGWREARGYKSNWIDGAVLFNLLSGGYTRIC